MRENDGTRDKMTCSTTIEAFSATSRFLAVSGQMTPDTTVPSPPPIVDNFVVLSTSPQNLFHREICDIDQ